MCLFSTVEASGPYSEKAKAQYAARVQKAKERNARIHAFYVARLKAYKAMLSKCKKCRSFICNR